MDQTIKDFLYKHQDNVFVDLMHQPDVPDAIDTMVTSYTNGNSSLNKESFRVLLQELFDSRLAVPYAKSFKLSNHEPSKKMWVAEFYNDPFHIHEIRSYFDRKENDVMALCEDMIIQGQSLTQITVAILQLVGADTRNPLHCSYAASLVINRFADINT